MVVMSKEILDVINTVIDYKKYICSHNFVVPKENFDWFSETEKYYHSLPLPQGMKRNRDDFEKIMSYANTKDLDRLNNTNYSDLRYTIWKR